MGSNKIVLPINNAKIAVCPREDIWFSFKKHFFNLNYFNESLMNILEYIDDENYQKVRNILIKFNKSQIEKFQEVNRKFNQIIVLFKRSKFENLFDFLNDVLDPRKNDFNILTLHDNLPKNREIWTNDKCLLIPIYFENLL